MQNSSVTSAEAFAIELYSTKVRFDSDGTGERQLDVRIKIESAAGAEQLRTLVFPYNAAQETSSLASLSVTKPNGAVVEPNANASPPTVEDDIAASVKDAPAFSDMHEVHIHVPPLAPGDTLRYEVVTKIVKPAAPGEFWYSHSFLLDSNLFDEELTIDVPANRAIHFRAAKQFPSTITTDGKRKIYSWKRTRDEILKDASLDALANSKTPDVILTSFASWEAVGRWLAAEEKQSSAEESTDVADKAQSLLTDAKTDADKIEALYDFVARDIRPIHVTTEQTGFLIRDPAKILSDGYGDAFDKCALLAAMLAAIHLHGDIALLPATEALDPNFPWPGALTATLLVVSSGKETYWMDPEYPAIPFRLVPPNLRDQQALVASSDTPPHLATTPQDPPFPSTQVVEINGQVSELGQLVAHVRYTLRGDNEYALRMAFYSTPKDQWKQVAQTMASLDGLRGEVSQVKPMDPAQTHDPFTLEFDLVNPEFLDWSKKQSLFTLPLPNIGLPDAPDVATKAVKLGASLEVTTKLTLTLPVTDTAQVPTGAGLTRDFADYQSHYDAQNHVITAERTLKFHAREVPASRRADYLAFASAVETDENQPVVVNNMIPDVPADALPRDLMSAGEAALKSGRYSNALRLFDRAQQLDPDHKGLWSDLGYAHLQMGQFDDAVAAFQKELIANPADDSANNLLGVALFDDKKYDEAAAAFQKQIALKPLDPDAHAYLGAVYVAEEKYQDALPELEKAMVITPDNAAVELRLGEAYLGLKKTDLALSTFEKTAKLSPTPTVENEIAFSLANANLALDRAQHLADDAVQLAETSLQKVDLQHLTEQDVLGMAALPSLWDTLGWVDFREGNLGAAEAYVRAAWLLGGDGDAADHLGQIYEARGDKPRAIAAYTQALAVGGAPGQTRARLEGLGVLQGDVDSGIKRAKAEVAQMRTLSIAKLGNEYGRAGFLILLAMGPDGPVVQDARFIGGDDRLSPAGERLRRVKFPDMLAPGSKARIVLRGILSCAPASSKCQLLLDRPIDLLKQK